MSRRFGEISLRGASVSLHTSAHVDSLPFPGVENSQSPFEELDVSEPRNTSRIQPASFPALPIQEPHARCRKRRQHFLKPLELFVRCLSFIGDFRLGLACRRCGETA